MAKISSQGNMKFLGLVEGLSDPSCHVILNHKETSKHCYGQ